MTTNLPFTSQSKGCPVSQRSIDDATTPPQPQGGWSEQIRTLTNALVVPATVPDMVQPAGIFDAMGKYVPEGVLWRGRPLMVEPPRPEPQGHLAGRWMWGGVLLSHFGHFLTESTGRLWGLTECLDGIVFIAKRADLGSTEDHELHDFHKLCFDLLQIRLPIRVITRPTTVEQLEVPGQGFGIGSIAAGTEQFRKFMSGRFGADIEGQGGERLYISRSELGASKGGVLAEHRIEAFLQGHGYDVFHPQKHPLTEQISRYKAAKQIVALDGSALHLVGMLCSPDQQVAIIRRRVSGASDTIVSHLSSFMGHPPALVDVIRQDWVRSDRRRADRFSVGELDLPALSAELARLGFVPLGAEMSGLTQEETLAAVRAIEAKLGRGKLKFEPFARGTKRKRDVEPPQASKGRAPTDAKPMNQRRAARHAMWMAARNS